MSKDSGAKYYQDNKERLQIKMNDTKTCLMNTKGKKDNIVMKNIKTSLKMKKKKLNEYNFSSSKYNHIFRWIYIF